MKTKKHRRVRGRKRRVGRSLTMLACGLSIGVGGLGAAPPEAPRARGPRTVPKGPTVSLTPAAWPKVTTGGPARKELDLALSAAS